VQPFDLFQEGLIRHRIPTEAQELYRAFDEPLQPLPEGPGSWIRSAVMGCISIAGRRFGLTASSSPIAEATLWTYRNYPWRGESPRRGSFSHSSSHVAPAVKPHGQWIVRPLSYRTTTKPWRFAKW
jgi:hypothetical protein